MRSLAMTVAMALVASPSAIAAASSTGPSPGPSHWVDKTTGGLPDEPLTLVAVDPYDDNVIYAGLDGFVFRSDDGGATFAPVLSFPRGTSDDGAPSTDDTDGTSFNESSTDRRDNSNDVSVNADPVDDTDLPDGSVDSRAGNAGIDDIPLAELADLTVAPRIEAGARSIAFVPQSKGVFLVATPRGLYRTTNGATSFDCITLPGGARENDIRDVVIDAGRPSRYFVGTAGGLFISKDGGASFARADGRVGTTAVVALAATNDIVVVGSERGLLRSRDAGTTFNDLLLRGSDAFPVIHAVALADGGSIVYAGVKSGLFAAERNSAILENYDGMPDDPPTAILPDSRRANGVIIATRTGEGGAFFSDDIGLTTVDHEPLPANQVMSLARETRDAHRLWVATERGLFRLEPGTGIRVSRDELQELRDRFAKEPSLDELTVRALENSRADVDVESARDRAGWAHLAPSLRAGYQLDSGDTNQTRTEFVFGDGNFQPPTGDPNIDLNNGSGLLVLQPSQKFDQRFWVNLTWDLDQVVLSPQLTQLGRQSTIIAARRISIADEVRRLFIMRRRLLAQVALDGKKATSTKAQVTRIHKELEVLEVEAHLAGLVGEDVFDDEASASRSASRALENR